MNDIIYDVDQFVNDPSFLCRFVDHLGLHCDKHFDQFLEPEKVLFGIADYEVMTGNGLGPLVQNENFDTISRAAISLKHFPCTRAASAVHDLEAVLDSLGFPKEPTERLAFLGSLTEAEHEELESRLAELDKKYYGSPYADTLWASRELSDAAREYMNTNLDVLRTRKK